MLMLRTAAILAPAILGIAMLAPAHAQDADTAAERARLANERIRLEAQRRAEEEKRRREEAEAAASADAAPAADAPPREPGAEPQPGTAAARTATPPAVAPAAPRTAPRTAPPAAAGDDGISRALEQLRELGELRDAGYVTEEEFERIKSRILEREF
jgi:hypothetical protein